MVGATVATYECRACTQSECVGGDRCPWQRLSPPLLELERTSGQPDQIGGGSPAAMYSEAGGGTSDGDGGYRTAAGPDRQGADR